MKSEVRCKSNVQNHLSRLEMNDSTAKSECFFCYLPFSIAIISYILWRVIHYTSAMMHDRAIYFLHALTLNYRCRFKIATYYEDMPTKLTSIQLSFARCHSYICISVSILQNHHHRHEISFNEISFIYFNSCQTLLLSSCYLYLWNGCK